MSLLKDWTACICVTLVVAVIFSLLMPKGKMSSFYKMIISLFVFLSFIYPLKNTSFDLKPIQSSFDYQQVESSNEKMLNTMIETQISTLLLDNKIENSSVIANVIQNENEIEIKSVSIAISENYDIEEVKSIVFENLGINAEVHKLGD